MLPDIESKLKLIIKVRQTTPENFSLFPFLLNENIIIFFNYQICEKEIKKERRKKRKIK